ncbi:hypothetical protein K9M78_06805 [Candidatus Bipolaricaulota bacterium]|nr:hypothetical protein [Candidatus Bipolaricaulota bacterium]
MVRTGALTPYLAACFRLLLSLKDKSVAREGGEFLEKDEVGTFVNSVSADGGIFKRN